MNSIVSLVPYYRSGRLRSAIGTSEILRLGPLAGAQRKSAEKQGNSGSDPIILRRCREVGSHRTRTP
jgi:hypothetical protein